MDEKVRQAIAGAVKREPFAQAFNMKLVELEEGHSVVEMVYDPKKMDNMCNRTHGGSLFGLIDEAFETAAQTTGTVAKALNVNITFVTRPQPGVTLRAEAIQVNQTKRTANFDIKIADQDGNVVAVCQALAYRTGRPLPFL